jgi:hypothetical protein
MKVRKFWQIIFSFLLIFGMLFSSLNLQHVTAQEIQEDLSINGSPFVLFDGSQYHIWYSVDDSTLFYASSSDPSSFTNGTPVTLNGEQPTSLANPAIIREGAFYYMFLYQFGANRRIVMYSSTNGIDWNYKSRVYIHPASQRYAYTLSGFEIERINGIYNLYFQAFDGDLVNGSIPPESDCTNKIYLARYAGNLSDVNPSFEPAQLDPVLRADLTHDWESVHVGAPSVALFDGNYYMWYTAMGADGLNRIGLASSADGLNWTRLQNDPVLVGSNVMVIQDQGRWDVWYQDADSANYQAGSVPLGFAAAQVSLEGLAGNLNLGAVNAAEVGISNSQSGFPVSSAQLKFTIETQDGSPLPSAVTSSFLAADPTDPSAEPSELSPQLVDGKVEYLLTTSAPWEIAAPASTALQTQITFAQAGDFRLTASLSDLAGTPPILISEIVTEFTVSEEINGAPVVYPIDDKTIEEMKTLQFIPFTYDPDVPPQVLTFSLTPDDLGATVNPETGEFVWTPAVGQSANSPYRFIYQACDNGEPQECDQEEFDVTVTPAANTPPYLAYPIADKIIDEGSDLIFIVPARDHESPPQTFTFSLSPDDIGAAINPRGRFSWTPTEEQGPMEQVFVLTLCDTYFEPACIEEEFTVTVNEVNVPPVMGALTDATIPPLVEFTFTATATDPDLPPQTLSFSLGQGAPDGAAIDPATGVFTWTPTSQQAEQSFTFDVCVSDGALESCAPITLTVTRENLPPNLYPIDDATIPEMVLYNFTAEAYDEPGSTLTFSLDEGAPAGAAVDPATGEFTWTPTEAQGPGVYPITLRVCDDGEPVRCSTRLFTLTVTEVNLAPVLSPITGTTIPELSPYTFTATATDPDLPAQTLTFSLIGAPEGAAIDPASGIFTWTPSEAQGPGTYPFTVQVCDDQEPELCATQEVTLTVTEVNQAPVLDPIENATIPELVPYTFTATATDPDLPAQTLTFSLTGAPTGAAIDPTTGVFTWTPTEEQGYGVYTFTVQVCDNFDPPGCASQEVTITVVEGNMPPTLDPIEDATIPELAAYSFTAAASDPDDPAQTLTFSLTGAPTGAAIDPTTGVFTWTPSEAQGPGTYPFTVKVCDDQQPPLCDSQEITLTVTEVNLAPVLSPIADATIPELSPYTFTATATDPDLPAQTLTFSLSGAPEGAAIDPASGEFTWTPSEAQGPGTYTFTVQVCDSFDPPACASQEVTITVVEGNMTPTLYPIDDATIPELVPYTFTVEASDADDPAQTLTFSLIGAPEGAAIDPTTGVFTWTPTEEQGDGVYPFTVKVCDSFDPPACASQEVTLTVTEVNQAPVLTPIPDQVVWEMELLSFTAAASDADLPTQELTFSLGATAPAGAAIDPATGVFTWTPTMDQGPAEYTFDVCVSDGIETVCLPVNVSVLEGNLPPVLYPIDDASIPELVEYSFTAEASDPNEGQVLTFSLIDAPEGAVIDPATGVFTWTPTEEQGYGVYPFTVQVCDDQQPALCAIRLVTLTVLEDNLPPTLYPIDDATIPEMEAYSFTARASDADDPAQTLTFSLIGAPDGAAIDPVTGVFTWTPSEAQGPGSYPFTVRVCDDQEPPACASQEVTLTVTETNQTPVLTPIADATIPELAPYTFTAEASDADDPAQTLTFSLIGAPEGAAIDPASGVFTWTPTEAQGPGTYTFSVQVCDSFEPPACASQEVTLTVTEDNQAPVLDPIENATIPELAPYSFTAAATDPDLPPQTLTFSLTGAPEGAMIDPATGVFTWTPTEAQGPGTYTFTVQVCDSFEPPACASQEVTLTVTEVNLAPVLGQIGSKTTPEMVLLTFTATATDPDLPAQTLTFSLVGAPTGAAIDPATGVFTWTPTEAQGPGTYSFDVCVSDGALSDCETITVTVTEANLPPVLAAIANATIPELAPYTFTATATDPDLPAQTLTFSLINAPTGAAIDPASGVFTWTPTEEQGPGTYTFTVQVCDNFDPPACDSQEVTLTVTEVSGAPVIPPIGNLSILEMEAFSYQIEVIDPDLPDDEHTFELLSGPEGLSLAAESGIITWTPTEAQGLGVYTVEVEVCDQTLLCDQETFTITVYEVNLAPEIVPIADLTIPEEVRFTYKVIGSDADLPAQTLTYSLIEAPSGATIGNLTGIFSWKPSEAQGPGVYDVTVRVCDNYTQPLCALESFRITVEEVPLPPVAVNDEYTMDENTTLSVPEPGVLANDSDPDSTVLTVQLVGQVSIGTLVLNPDGSFEYTPPANYYGDVSFRYQVEDESGMVSNLATVTIHVLNAGGDIYLPLIFR